MLSNKYRNINDRALFELHQLLEATTPESMRKSLHILLSYFLIEAPHLDGEKYRKMIEDAIHLLNFINNLEEK